MLKQFLNPPNWFTSASMFCGLYSIFLATGVAGDPNFYRAALMILFAGVFDMLDGRIARMTGTGSDFGIQLDSLADVISFGLAPAVLMYAWGLDGLGVVGLFGSFAFMLCGAFRLARFNCDASGEVHTLSEGLAITMAGGTVASAVMAHAASGRVGVEHPVSVWFLAAILSVLMVSRVPYRTAKTLRLSLHSVLLLSLFFGVVLAVAVRLNFSSTFIVIAAVYTASGPAEAIFRRLFDVPYDEPPPPDVLEEDEPELEIDELAPR